MGLTNRFRGTQIFQAARSRIGGSTATVGVGGVISSGVTPAAQSGTGLQTLQTATIPAKALDRNGRGIYVQAWGTYAGNANQKSVQLNVGGLSLSSGSSTGSGTVWVLEGRVFRTAANAQRGILYGNVAGALSPAAATDTSVDTGTITVTVKAASGSGSQSDIIAQGLFVEYLP